MDSRVEKSFLFELRSGNGQLIETGVSLPGETNYTLDTSTLAAGTYFLTVKDPKNNSSQVFRLVKSIQ